MTQDEDLLADVELSKALSDAEKAAHEARLAELQLQEQEYSVLEKQLELDARLSGVFVINRAVTPALVNKLHKKMRLWHKYRNDGPWTIHLNSVGGCAYSGAAIIDELKSHSKRLGGTHEIEIKVRGLAASAASMILQAADIRTIGPSSELMIHHGTSAIWGSVSDFKDEVEWWEDRNDAMINLFLDRTNKISKKDFRKRIERKDWYVSPKEALKLGFVDRIG